MVWAAYALALLLTLPFTPLGVLWMLAPLLVTGWYARNWLIPAAVGLGHGALLSVIVIWLGVFPLAINDPATALAAGLLLLVSWFTAIAGRTIRLVSVVRQQDALLAATQQEIDETAAGVEAIWHATSVALISLDSQGRVLSWNPGAEQVFSRSAASMTGRSFAELGAKGDPDDCLGPIMYALESQRHTPPFEGRLSDGRGRVLEVEVRTRPVTHPGGDLGLILTVIDRTREHLMEDILEEQAERQDRLLQNLEEVLYSVEVPSRRTGMLTRTVERLTGRGIAEFGDFQDFMALAHPDDRQVVMDRWEHARSGEKSTLRWRIRTEHGNHVWIEDRIVPVRNEEGRVVRLDGIIRRIFREIELERQAQRMTRWLDALEPAAGTGAWSVDLRSGEWTWSKGMAGFVGTDQAEYEQWARCVVAEDRPILQTMADDPEGFVSPQRIHMVGPDGRHAPYVLEAWLQRGNDGEPIHLYGVLHREAAPTVLRRPPRPRRLPSEAIEQAWPTAVRAGPSAPLDDGPTPSTPTSPAVPAVEARAMEDIPEALATQAEAPILAEPVPATEPKAPEPAIADAPTRPHDLVASDPSETHSVAAEAAGQDVVVGPAAEPWFEGAGVEADDPDRFDADDEAPAEAFAEDYNEPDFAGAAYAEPEAWEHPHEAPPRTSHAPAVAKRVHAVEEEVIEEDIQDATWDDDVGWVPAKHPKPLLEQDGPDAAEEVAAKQWPEHERPKPRGPWSLE